MKRRLLTTSVQNCKLVSFFRRIFLLHLHANNIYIIQCSILFAFQQDLFYNLGNFNHCFKNVPTLDDTVFQFGIGE